MSLFGCIINCPLSALLFVIILVEKNQGVFMKHSGNKVLKAIFGFKVKVKVTRSLTLVTFERASLVEYAC